MSRAITDKNVFVKELQPSPSYEDLPPSYGDALTEIVTESLTCIDLATQEPVSSLQDRTIQHFGTSDNGGGIGGADGSTQNVTELLENLAYALDNGFLPQIETIVVDMDSSGEHKFAQAITSTLRIGDLRLASTLTESMMVSLNADAIGSTQNVTELLENLAAALATETLPQIETIVDEINSSGYIEFAQVITSALRRGDLRLASTLTESMMVSLNTDAISRTTAEEEADPTAAPGENSYLSRLINTLIEIFNKLIFGRECPNRSAAEVRFLPRHEYYAPIMTPPDVGDALERPSAEVTANMSNYLTEEINRGVATPNLLINGLYTQGIGRYNLESIREILTTGCHQADIDPTRLIQEWHKYRYEQHLKTLEPTTLREEDVVDNLGSGNCAIYAALTSENYILGRGIKARMVNRATALATQAGIREEMVMEFQTRMADTTQKELRESFLYSLTAGELGPHADHFTSLIPKWKDWEQDAFEQTGLSLLSTNRQDEIQTLLNKYTDRIGLTGTENNQFELELMCHVLKRAMILINYENGIHFQVIGMDYLPAPEELDPQTNAPLVVARTPGHYVFPTMPFRAV